MENAVGMPQSAVVFGGASEIALATVRALVPRGLRRIVLAVRRPEDLVGEIEQLEKEGAESVEAVPFDATAFDTHDEVVRTVVDRLGDVDLVLLAFGVLGDQAAFDADPDSAVRAAETNYVAAVSIGLRIAEVLRRQGHGVLAVLSSVAGVRVRQANLVYGSTKAGLDGFASGLGDALAGTGARVLIVRPGFVTTRMTEGMDPAPLSTTADGVAADIVRGLERGDEVVWSPAPLRWLMAVLRALPRPVWRRLPR